MMRGTLILAIQDQQHGGDFSRRIKVFSALQVGHQYKRGSLGGGPVGHPGI